MAVILPYSGTQI